MLLSRRARLGLRAKLDLQVTLYSRRHTLGRWMRARGVPKWEVQGQFGHGKGVTERYAEFDPLFQNEATAAIGALWQELQRSGDTPGTLPEVPGRSAVNC